jgi:hypothetical protein
VRDNYSTSDKAGNPICPATTRLDAIRKAEEPSFKITWFEGNMPRKPKTWEEWSATAYIGGERPKSFGFDSAKWKREREEREAKERAERQAELDAACKEASALSEAARLQKEAELESLKQAAKEKEAELKAAKKKEEAKARQATAEKSRVEAKLAKACEVHGKLEQRVEEEKARVEMELARTLAAKEQLELAAEDKLCCICSDSNKCIMFEPCRHVSCCEGCAPKVDACPLCRQVPTRKVPVYL